MMSWAPSKRARGGFQGIVRMSTGLSPAYGIKRPTSCSKTSPRSRANIDVVSDVSPSWEASKQRTPPRQTPYSPWLISSSPSSERMCHPLS